MLLASDEGVEVVKQAAAQARRFRVAGVPFFVVNGTVTLPGALPPDAFLEAFRRALVPK